MSIDSTDSHNGPSPGLLRDPRHTITIQPSEQVWSARIGSRVLANIDRALIWTENGYTDVFYFPPEHVRFDQLGPSRSTSTCPFKGTAGYFTLIDGEADIAWVYPETFDEVSEIAGHLAFYAHSVDLETL